MYHYLFTNDLRITNLQSALVKAGKCFMTDTVPSASENKNENNNMNTLGFYFNLTSASKCSADCANGHVRKVVLNFIKKFQFPNPRTSESLDDAINDGISLAPMRIVLQTLYTMNLLYPGSAYISRDEVLNFIFFNSSVAKTKAPNIVDLINSIIEYRKTQRLPSTIEQAPENRQWKQMDRQVREMVKILTWSGCIIENENQALCIHHDSLSTENKAALFDILTYTKFWMPDGAKSFSENKASYQNYMDVEECEPENDLDTAEDLSPEWFKNQATKLGDLDHEAKNLYQEFRTYFAPEKLQSLSDKALLDSIFYSDHRAEHNLCYTLEHDPRFQLFGSIKGGSSYKFGLFFSKEHNSWVTGSPKKVKKLTEDEAVELGTSILKELISGTQVISEFRDLESLNDYADLYAEVFKVMPNLINKLWVMKYFHIMFPSVFPVFYNDQWQNDVLDRLGIEPKESMFIRMGQIALFAKQCGISNVAFSKVIYSVKSRENPLNDKNEDSTDCPTCSFDVSRGGAQNRVVYGTPGCGKSYYVQNKLLNDLGVDSSHRIRTTFYMDYTNTDFIGQILPKVKQEGDIRTVTYDFNPGPFALALQMSIENPDDPVALVIEELNRGNAASIFGDIFQLLDRDKTGKSQYSITNVNLQDYLNQCFKGQYIFNDVRIPANLYLIATMNTSDQNVFTLDTAFKRRWQFEKLRNNFTESHAYKGYYVPGAENLTWECMVTAINNFIISQPDDFSSEDKQLGVYFVDESILCSSKEDCNDEKRIERFAYKLFEYLWDDVAKFSRSDWFIPDIKTLDQLIDSYKKIGISVFSEGVIPHAED